MAAFADLSEVVNRLSNGNSGNPQLLYQFLDSRVGAAAATATVASRWSSLWTYNASRGGGGVAPTTTAIPTNATNGTFLHNNPSGGRQLWLTGNSAITSTTGALLLYDRLLHNGNLSGTVTTAQTVGGTLTRNTGGAGNQIWVEIYTLIGTTATTITASYTNQNGTSGQVTPAVAIGGTGLREATRWIQLPLAAGDTGVQAVASVTLAATTGTAGAFGVTIAKPIYLGSISTAGSGFNRDFLSGFPVIPEIETGAALSLAYYAAATAAPQVMYGLSLVER